MAVHPRSLQNLKTPERLKSGVTSETHRIRASKQVQAWWRAWTAEERGEIIADVMRSRGVISSPEVEAQRVKAGMTSPPRPTGLKELSNRAYSLLRDMQTGWHVESNGKFLELARGGATSYRVGKREIKELLARELVSEGPRGVYKLKSAQ